MLNVSTSKIVGSFHYGEGSLKNLAQLLNTRREEPCSRDVLIIDDFFESQGLLEKINLSSEPVVFFINASEEPSTEGVDALKLKVLEQCSFENVSAIVGIGGGVILDTAKAISNLLTNPGSSENYQGWDLVKNPGVFKVGVPTLSGTGAEASRTCVLTNKKKNIKLGMNSPFSVYDHLILDPELTRTVERNQYFYTAMDTYIHCIESLEGSFRHPFADAFSLEALRLVKEVMTSEDMMSDENRAKMMTASYFGGSAVGNSFVGVVHPISAGLSTVFGIKHCVANCMVMQQMEEFYPRQFSEFMEMKERQKVQIPSLEGSLSDKDFQRLYESSTVHEKPLVNALGDNFKNILTLEKVSALYKKM